jgi:heterotetrameric sarcosine oxidase gamma subunit
MPYDAQIESRNDRALLAVRASGDGCARVSKTLAMSLPPAGGTQVHDGVLCLPVARDEWLVSVAAQDEESTFRRIDESLGGRGGAVVVVSDAYHVARISGPQTDEVMAQILSIDTRQHAFSPGSATRAGFGRASALIHRLDDAAGYDIYIDVTLARYADTLFNTCRGV